MLKRFQVQRSNVRVIAKPTAVFLRRNNHQLTTVHPLTLGVKLPSILWSDRVSRFKKKFAECNNSFFLANFQLQFDSLHLSLS